MTSAASAAAQVLSQNTDDDVLQALQLFVSLRPEFREVGLTALQQEPMPRYLGKIMNFNQSKGFGFINSEEATADFGKDTFLSDKEIGQFQVGDIVSFTIVVNKDNKPQARLVQGPNGDLALGGPLLASPPPPPAHLQQQMLMPKQAVWGPPQPPPQAHVVGLAPARHAFDHTAGPPQKARRLQEVPQVPVPPPAVLPAGARGGCGDLSSGPCQVGTIASFFPDKCYGFISCDAIQQQFGKDVFLSNMEIGHFKVGDTVSFNVVVKGGKPQARNLKPNFGEVAPPNAAFSVAGAGGRPMLVPQQQAAMAGAGEDGRYVGVITNFNAEKRYGFIQCEEVTQLYGKDTFLSDQEIGQCDVGSQISFRVVVNNKGQPQARECQPMGGGASAQWLR